MDSQNRSWRFLECALACAAASLLVLHLSPNTADPDLWGHVAFGSRILETGQVEKADPFSWTAPGGPWINHEVLAEVAMAWAHRIGGGAGLLILKVAAGLLAFTLALLLGMNGTTPAGRMMAWAVAAVAAVEVGFGFACRPQIFTAVAIPLLFLFLRLAHEKHFLWVIPLPFLFCVWFNTHGGALAGLALLAAASAATTTVTLLKKSVDRLAGAGVNSLRLVPALWLALALSIAASALNPWGWDLPAWLVRSVSWTRPQIEEWAPTQLGWDHAAFFALAAALAASLVASRLPVRAWEAAMAAVLAIAAARHVRHTPLFALAALAMLPAHLESALLRIQPRVQGLADLFRRERFRSVLAIALCAVSLLSLRTAWTREKQDPLTMEVPARLYPVDAVRFMKERGIQGKVLVFFDWGEMCIWELPRCKVSIDGRLDTCYPRQVIDAHWRVFRGEMAPDEPLVRQADFALLPPDIRGTLSLLRTGDWLVVYADQTAAVLQRRNAQPPCLPAPTTTNAAPSRVPFPSQPFTSADR